MGTETDNISACDQPHQLRTEVRKYFPDNGDKAGLRIIQNLFRIRVAGFWRILLYRFKKQEGGLRIETGE
jgi:hypothetical protein